MTGPFSQLLLLLDSQLENVHHRALLLEVATGEHQSVIDGVAAQSHPWLLYKLSISVGLDLARVGPLPATLEFLQVLAETFDSIASALGAIGVGNERMLLTEYRAVERCFELCLPRADFRAFLRANIEEDQKHSEAIERVVSALDSGVSAQAYVAGAQLGVRARVDYYDRLVAHWERNGIPTEWHRTGDPSPSTPKRNGMTP